MNRFSMFVFILLSGCSASSTPTTAGGGAPGSPGGGSGSGGSGSGGSSGGAVVADAGSGNADAGGLAAIDGGSVGSPACDGGACASLTGFVKRTATKPTHGGKGAVYVAVFDGNPITNTKAAMVANVLVPGEDMTSDTAQVAYRVPGVPVRGQAYQVIAFLDDANAVTAASPKPASGDLVSLDLSAGFGGVPVTVSGTGDVSLDLPLNVAMP